MLGVSLIIIAAAIVYMVETYISTYYTIEYMHGTSLFLILLAKYGTPVLFLLLCAYIADELPNSLEAEISGGNQLIMNYEQAQELFGIKFRRWLGIFNL